MWALVSLQLSSQNLTLQNSSLHPAVNCEQRRGQTLSEIQTWKRSKKQRGVQEDGLKKEQRAVVIITRNCSFQPSFPHQQNLAQLVRIPIHKVQYGNVVHKTAWSLGNLFLYMASKRDALSININIGQFSNGCYFI